MNSGFCSRHSRYRGKGKVPTNKCGMPCEVCFNISIRFLQSKRRIAIRPTKIVPDKKKYSRKSKHKR